MFSVFLSYTAFELLFQGIAEYFGDDLLKDERHDFLLTDPAIADDLKKNSKLAHYLLHEKSDGVLLARINDFFCGYDENLMPILAGIRNKVAHGHLSVAGINADSKANSDSLWEASKLLLYATDDLFYSFVRSIE